VDTAPLPPHPSRMTAPENSYWSIEACAWVRHPLAEAEVPAQRPAEDAVEVVDLDAEQPTGAPV
jgi:hypothetical protein